MAEKVTIGNCELWHGDCREVLPLLPPVDLVLTDPPYGVEFRGEAWDKDVPKIALDLPDMFPRVAIIMGTTAAWQFPPPKWVACWARPASSSRSKVGGFSHWSPILLYGDIKMKVDFRSWHAIANAYETGFDHPSPKPIRLMVWLVEELSEVGETILDPFLGSGTTGVAAVQMGRSFVGIERERKYFDIACRRIEQAYAQPRLFEDAKVGAGETAVQGDMLLPANAELWGAPPTGGASHTNAVLGAAVPPAPTFDKGENDERD